MYRKISPAHLIVLLWVMLTLGFALTPVIESTLVKMVLVLPTVFFIPGYMLLTVLFPKSRRDAAPALLLIFIVASAAGMVYFVISTPGTGERFTEFYILDPSGKAENYPSDLKYDSPVTFPVGVTNHEYSPVNYTVQVALDKNILTYTKFTLDHNETWRNNMTFVPGKEGRDMELEFWLFKEDNLTVPYRELQLRVSGVK